MEISAKERESRAAFREDDFVRCTKSGGDRRTTRYRRDTCLLARPGGRCIFFLFFFCFLIRVRAALEFVDGT